jgi:nanoRNase/pAp phosphatase (c-di-AMP/oligoRNAs hydrolase)
LNDDKLDELYTMGQIILKANTTIVKKQVSQSYLGFLPQQNMEIPLVNTPILVSETCHALLEDERYADYPFVAAWFVDNRNQVNYSLRSRSNFDCSQIAKQYGGGGHPQASGFSCSSFPTRKQ